MADEIKNQSNQEKKTANPQGSGTELDKVKAEVEDVKKQRDEYLNGWKRAKADLINYQKEEAKRFEDMAKFSAEDILLDIINILQNYNFGIAAIEKSGGKVDNGLLLVKGQLEDLLKRRGITKITIQVGDVFNPQYHEAVEMAEGDGKFESGKIAEVVEDGYTLHAKVLRAVKVKVVK